MELVSGIVNKPYKVLNYGQAGVGKTTWATMAQDPVILDVERGADRIDCLKTPYINSSENLYQFIREIVQKNMARTLVLDSADALQKIFVNEILAEFKIKALSDYGYGKGYELLNAKWEKFIDSLDWLKDNGFNSIVIGHEVVKRHEDPRLAEGYDRILLKMHQKSAGTLIPRMDAVLYMTYDVTIVKGEKNAKAKAFGKGERVMFTSETPAFVAKNRYGMPDKINKQEEVFSFLPKFS